MTGLIPFNKRNNVLSTGFDDFYSILDDFFNDSRSSRRNIVRNTFKLDVRETDKEYLIEAELPGVQKEEIDLNINEGYLTISINKEENINEDNNNYIHRERHLSSMSRSIRLEDIQSDNIKAKLENGILMISVSKKEKESNSFKINIE